MRNYFSRLVVIAFVMSALFAQVAFASVTGVDPVLNAEGEAVLLTANQNADGTVDLTWSRYVGSDFDGYKVVHSTSNPDLEYPADGYLKYITDSSSLSYVHAGPSAGMNYYRICTLVNTGVLCSNVVEIDSQFDLSATNDVTSVSDPYTDDSEIVINLAVNMTDEGKVSLLWTKYTGGDLRWYKVMHSTDNPLMYYPVDPHLVALSYAAETSYIHEPSAGLNYYRVCVITIDDRRGCSDTQIVNSENSGDMPFVSLFSDMKDHWAKEYVNILAAAGVVSGIDGKFVPEREVNRAEALKMIMYAFDYTEGTCDVAAFPDMKASDWFCDVASLAEKKGFISGDNGYLMPARGLTRAEAVKIVIEVKGDIMAMVNIPPFADVKADDWYARYAAHAKKLGLVKGIDGDFLPNRNISRAELAKIVSVAMDLAAQADL